MSLNCKQGDLAFTRSIDGFSLPVEYVGRFVEVVEPKGYVGRDRTLVPGHHWYVRPLGWIPSTCTLRSDGCFQWPDALLRPIRGTDAQADTFESRELEAA